MNRIRIIASTLLLGIALSAAPAMAFTATASLTEFRSSDELFEMYPDADIQLRVGVGCWFRRNILLYDGDEQPKVGPFFEIFPDRYHSETEYYPVRGSSQFTIADDGLTFPAVGSYTCPDSDVYGSDVRMSLYLVGTVAVRFRGNTFICFQSRDYADEIVPMIQKAIDEADPDATSGTFTYILGGQEFGAAADLEITWKR
jgi:hypothetical protein